jgi:multisubunit Na+/H+ antiporter MnhE subunit
MTAGLLWTLLLIVVYALAVGSFAPWDLLLGFLVAVVLVAGLRRHVPGTGIPGPRLLWRLGGVPALAAAVLRDMTIGTWQVAAVVLGIRPLRRPGVVAIPIGDRSEAGALATAFIGTLAPGEFLVEIDWERRVLLFHVLDAGDPARVRARFAASYRNRQRRVVP